MLNSLYKLERDLMQEVISYEGTDREMANFVAQDRNDVILARDLFNEGLFQKLKDHVDHMDTYPREGVVMAFVADLGKGWVFENLGYTVN